jgi:hypothetical protein
MRGDYIVPEYQCFILPTEFEMREEISHAVMSATGADVLFVVLLHLNNDLLF